MKLGKDFGIDSINILLLCLANRDVFVGGKFGQLHFEAFDNLCIIFTLTGHVQIETASGVVRSVAPGVGDCQFCFTDPWNTIESGDCSHVAFFEVGSQFVHFTVSTFEVQRHHGHFVCRRLQPEFVERQAILKFGRQFAESLFDLGLFEGFLTEGPPIEPADIELSAFQVIGPFTQVTFESVFVKGWTFHDVDRQDTVAWQRLCDFRLHVLLPFESAVFASEVIVGDKGQEHFGGL